MLVPVGANGGVGNINGMNLPGNLALLQAVLTIVFNYQTHLMNEIIALFCECIVYFYGNLYRQDCLSTLRDRSLKNKKKSTISQFV